MEVNPHHWHITDISEKEDIFSKSHKHCGSGGCHAKGFGKSRECFRIIKVSLKFTRWPWGYMKIVSKAFSHVESWVPNRETCRILFLIYPENLDKAYSLSMRVAFLDLVVWYWDIMAAVLLFVTWWTAMLSIWTLPSSGKLTNFPFSCLCWV